MRLKLCCEIVLYPDIFEFRGVDRKTYGAIFLRRLQSEKALIFHPFHDTSNALSVYSGALGGVARTTDYNSTKALLAVMHTPAADIVVLASPVCIKEECPFEFPLLAPAHRSCSGFRSLWGLGLSSCGSDFAALSLSMMEDFSPLSGALASVSFGPLLMIPSIMP